MHNAIPARSSSDLKALTSLRFFAALMIFAFHLREYNSTPWLYAVASPMLHGVSFFFVLSGFILTHVYQSDSGFPYRKFLLSRFARLYPTVLSSTLVLLVALPLAAARGQNGGPQLAAISFIAKISMLDSIVPIRGVQFAWNSVSWSVSTEFFFYGAFPFILMDFRRNWAIKLFVSALSAIAVLCVALWLRLPLAEGDRTTVTVVQLSYANPLARGFEFVLGMSAYLAWRRWIQPSTWSARAWTVIEAALLLALLVWLGYAVPVIARSLSGAVWVWFRTSGSCLAFAAIIPIFASARGAIGRALTQRPLVWLGEVSFAFYMFHLIVMRATNLYFGNEIPALLIFALSLNLAAVNHRWIEIPARRFILEAFGRARPRPAPLAAMET